MTAAGTEDGAVIVISGFTVKLKAFDLTELAGTDALDVSTTVTVRLLNVPALPTEEVEQFPVFADAAHVKPEGKLLGVKL
jgi:hypothetical protein